MKMADALKSKLHYIMLMGNDGNQIVIGTDDLAEVSRQTWFKRMTGEGTQQSKRVEVDIDEDELLRREEQVKRAEERLQAQREVEARRRQEPVQRVQQPVQQQRQQPQQ